MGEIAPAAGPCPPPEVADFYARFPEFTEYPDTLIELAIDDASCWADTGWTNNCSDCTKAIMFLAAHLLVLQARAAATLPTSTEDSSGGTSFTEGGQVTSISFETMRVAFAKPQATRTANSSSQGSGGKDLLNLTASPYGQFYLALLRANVPAVLVV